MKNTFIYCFFPIMQYYFLKALENPHALKVFGTALQSLYWKSFFLVLGIILLLFAWYSAYMLIKKISFPAKKQKLSLNEVKSSLFLSYEKSKNFFFQARYLLIWATLQLLSWKLASFIFNALPQEVLTHHTSEYNDINLLLGKRTIFSLLIFMIAPYFITFSFGNKFVCNLGILTYIVGIWFILFGFLLQLGTLA